MRLGGTSEPVEVICLHALPAGKDVKLGTQKNSSSFLLDVFLTFFVFPGQEQAGTRQGKMAFFMSGLAPQALSALGPFWNKSHPDEYQ